MHGYWIEEKGRIKNPVFDKIGEKTTTKIVYRPCKNQDEADYTIKTIEMIVETEEKK